MQTLLDGVWAQGIKEDCFDDSKSLVTISGQAERDIRYKNHGGKCWRTSFDVMGRKQKQFGSGVVYTPETAWEGRNMRKGD